MQFMTRSLLEGTRAWLGTVAILSGVDLGAVGRGQDGGILSQLR